MKDILMRVTNAEKDLLTYMRSLTAFELKDLTNQYINLSALSKVADTGLDIALSQKINQQLEQIFTEREFYVLRKLQKKTTSDVSATKAGTKAGIKSGIKAETETGTKVETKAVINADTHDDSDTMTSAGVEEYSDPTIFDVGIDVAAGFDPSIGKADDDFLADETILPDVSNNIMDKFISRNYRNYIINANKSKESDK